MIGFLDFKSQERGNDATPQKFFDPQLDQLIAIGHAARKIQRVIKEMSNDECYALWDGFEEEKRKFGGKISEELQLWPEGLAPCFRALACLDVWLEFVGAYPTNPANSQ